MGLLVVALFFAFYVYFSVPGVPEVSSQDFTGRLAKGDVSAVTIDPDGDGFSVRLSSGEGFHVAEALNAASRTELKEQGVRIRLAKPPTSFATWAIPLGGLFIVTVFAVAVVRSRKAGAGILGLRKTTARLLSERPETSFESVGGAAVAKAALRDVVEFLKHPKHWEAAGARLPQGVLLEGPPGSGKTLLARAVAGESKVAFFEVSASEFVELFVGVGAARVRDLFEQAAKKAPAVIFIDEIDAIGRRRGSGSVALTHQEREQTLNQLLVSLDGFRRRKNVVVIAATNRADVLDPALLRPGRFDLRVDMKRPADADRREILCIHAKGKSVAEALITSLAARSEGFSGAELEHLMNEGARSAAKRASEGQNGSFPLVGEDFTATLVQHAARVRSFDPLDALLAESNQQFSQPVGRVVARATMEDGVVILGDLMWADPVYLKFQTLEHGGVVVAKGRVSRLEIQPGTAPLTADALAPERFARPAVDAA